MLKFLKKKIKLSKKLILNVYAILSFLNRIKFFLRFFEFIQNEFKIILNKKTNLNSIDMFRLIKQKNDIKKILKNQIREFKKNNKTDEIFIAIEIGSLLGENIENIGNMISKNIKDFLIISIDPYTDYLNQVDKHHSKILQIRSNTANKIYRYFNHNISLLKYRNKIIHLRDYSGNSLRLLRKVGLKADFIYIDGAHYYKNIKEDFLLSKELIKFTKPYKGKICGDDFYVKLDDHNLFNLSKKNFLKLLKKNKKREVIEMLIKKSDKFKKIYFHPGITLFFSEISSIITKYDSGIWQTKKNN